MEEYDFSEEENREEFLEMVDKELEAEDMGRQMWKQFEPVKKSLEYIHETISSDDEYFDPVHAARIRENDANKPIDEIIDFDLSRTLGRGEPIMMDMKTGDSFDELNEHVVKSDLVEKHLYEQGDRFNVGRLKEEGRFATEIIKEVENLDEVDGSVSALDKILEYRGNPDQYYNTNIDIEDFVSENLSDSDWKHSVGYLNSRAGDIMEDNILMRNGYEVEHADIAKKLRNVVENNLPLERYDGRILPEQPIEVGVDLFKQFAEGYKNKRDGLLVSDNKSSSEENTDYDEGETDKVSYEILTDELENHPIQLDGVENLVEELLNYELAEDSLDLDTVVDLRAHAFYDTLSNGDRPDKKEFGLPVERSFTGKYKFEDQYKNILKDERIKQVRSDLKQKIESDELEGRGTRREVEWEIFSKMKYIKRNDLYREV